MHRFLFGPSDDATFADRFLAGAVSAGRWSRFPASCPSWEVACGGSTPEALLLWPGYTSVPAWVWSVPVPVVALAHDPNLLFHGFRELLPLADLVLTDSPSTDRLRRAGIGHVRPACLYGLDRHFLAELDEPEVERDIDVAFVGNLNPSVQRSRGPWLNRLMGLADRFRVRVTTGVFGGEYRALLRRSKLVFNLSIRGECNLRAFEAAACGAVLLQEADNAEVQAYLEPDAEYLRYDGTNFERVVGELLADEPRRREIADRAKGRVRGYSFEALIEKAIGVGAPEWEAVRERAARRAANPPSLSLAGRVAQRASLTGPDADPALAADLEAAGDRHGLAVVSRNPAAAEPHLAAAAEGGNRVSAVGHASALHSLGRRDAAVAVLRKALAELEANPVLSAVESASVPHPVRFDHLRCDRERAAFDHPDDPAAENRCKLAALRARAAAVLAELTGEIATYRLAVECGPHVPAARAALGCALARAGNFAEGVAHLRWAVEHDPFDNPAARALEATLAAGGDVTGAAAARRERALLARAAPGLIDVGGRTPGASPVPRPQSTSTPPQPPAPTPPPSAGTAPAEPLRTRFVELSRADFHARFGTPDVSRAVSGYTPPHDTAAVLTLLNHLKPLRVLEVGTALGQMTANLTHFSPPDAVVYSLGIGGDDAPPSGAKGQEYEVPRRGDFARFLNALGTGHKARLILADSRSFDFARLGTLDFAFVDGGHDFDTVLSDSLRAHAALRQGGCLVWHDLPSPVAWVEVERAVAAAAFRERVYKVAGTQVAFLVRGEGLGAVAGPASATVSVNWEGEFAAVHSLAAVNRAVCSELLARGHDVGLVRSAARTVGATPFELPPELEARLGRVLPGAITVRHAWPPNFAAPAGDGPLVLVQPWEFGRLPREWVGHVLSAVDEVWAYSRSVLRAYAASGVPEERVALVPLGVDPDAFRPGLGPLSLPTAKKVKLLFVGGTIPRKGFDVLLAAYRKAFTSRDDVTLVVKDLGVGTFYRGQTAESAIAAHRSDPDAPEVVHLTDDLSEADMAGLYAACDVLTHPYRGEGFGLPVLEAMACGKPVVVTAGGPTDEFVPPAAGWKVGARLHTFPEERVGGIATAGLPWWLEPDADALVAVLREVVADAGERARRGAAARRAAMGWTWARTASAVEDRIRLLRGKTPVRFRKHPVAVPVSAPPVLPPAPQPLPVPATRPQADPGPRSWTSDEVRHVPQLLSLFSDEPEVVGSRPTSSKDATVPAVARGKPEVALTMIVRNEEHNLGHCLASVRDLVDKAFVIDTGSTDRTREIARSFGAVVGEFPWIDHFAAARNAALDLARGDYAFWMDADDRLDDENRVKLKTLFDNLPGLNDAYVMKCLCVPDKPGAGGTVVDHVRLFRLVPQHRWSFRVHEQILPALRSTDADVKWADVTVRHVGYVDPALRRRKLDRDLRLLKMDEAERPKCAFTLFNLGCVYRELGDHPAAVRVLEGSLAASHPRDSIVRKLYAMLAQSHGRTRDWYRAEEALHEGRRHYPDDAELLFLAGNLAKDRGRFDEAEDLYRRLIDGTETAHFASVDAGLRPVKGRHNLAVMLMDRGREAEAEGLWRAALVEDPQFLPAHLGLGELALKAGRGSERVAAAMRELGPEGAAEAVNLEARVLLRRGDHAGALSAVEAALREHPGSPALRVTLSHVRLGDGSPPAVLEAALRGVLEVDPGNAQALHNLRVLMRNTGRSVEGVIDPPDAPDRA